jgi:nitroreductase
MSTLISSLNWRYATKKYDAHKKITDEQFEVLLDAIQLAPTSYGLQAFQTVVITDPHLREQLKPKAWNQPQITDASHLILFCAMRSIPEQFIDQYVTNMTETRGLETGSLNGFGGFIKQKIGEQSTEQILQWNKKQTYIALGFLLAACAELHIDSTPMEGFESEAFDEILGLKQMNLTSSVLCAVGYRSEEDTNQHLAKVRRSNDELILWK